MRCAVRCTLLENEIESSDHRDEKRKGDVIVKQRTSVTRDKSRREPISPETRLFLHFTTHVFVSFRIPKRSFIAHRRASSHALRRDRDADSGTHARFLSSAVPLQVDLQVAQSRARPRPALHKPRDRVHAAERRVPAVQLV